LQKGYVIIFASNLLTVVEKSFAIDALQEKEIKAIFDSIPRTVTITIIPSFVYDHIMKK